MNKIEDIILKVSIRTIMRKYTDENKINAQTIMTVNDLFPSRKFDKNSDCNTET
jgi:hypothetical protein